MLIDAIQQPEAVRPGAARGGNGASFAALLEAMEPGLRRYLRHQLIDPEASRDAVQETFLRMLRYRRCSDIHELRALLFRVAASVVADHYRQARTRQWDRHCSMDSLDVGSSEPQPDRVLADQQSLQCVKAAIRRLPPRCRQVFLLHRFEGMSYRAIAGQLGISERTVENQIAHALTICRRALGETGGRTFK